jgi:CrcB protein
VTALLVAVGAATGAALRFLVSRVLAGRPGTLAANVAGCLALGALLGAPGRVWALLGIGLCGGLTTFSTYALEVIEGGGVRYLVLTTAACLAAAAAGLAVSPW